MTTILKICAAAILLSVLYTILRSWLPAWAPLVSIAGVLLLASLFLMQLEQINPGQWVDKLKNNAGSDALLCMCKAAAILWLAGLSRDLCKDSGLSSVAGCIELAGRFLVLTAAWPIFSQVWAQIERLV